MYHPGQHVIVLNRLGKVVGEHRDGYRIKYLPGLEHAGYVDAVFSQADIAPYNGGYKIGEVIARDGIRATVMGGILDNQWRYICKLYDERGEWVTPRLVLLDTLQFVKIAAGIFAPESV